MAFIGWRLPADISRFFSGLPVPGTTERIDRLHTTALFLGDGLSAQECQNAADVMEMVNSDIRPFAVVSQNLATFSKARKGIPLVALVESDGLRVAKNLLQGACDQLGVSYFKRAEYTPHITLSYLTTLRELSPGFMDFPLQTWEARELTFWKA